MQTANGYQSSTAPDRLTGTYTVSADVLRVTWSGGQWEEWTVSTLLDGKIAKLTLRANNFGATHAFGSGSRCAAGRTDKAQYHISMPTTSGTSRRDTLWHWFTANGDDIGVFAITDL
ncbi:MAG TPA: hypothetical protein VF062_09430 [Candidatus Limnocylindrales bacterium]